VGFDVVGELVGDDVVGEVDGDCVGVEVVGDTDGDTVGDDVVGDNDGDSVGVEVVGDPVGDFVGLAVGFDVVGDNDGDSVGVEVVGDPVGDFVGLAVGFDVVGTRVGESVGQFSIKFDLVANSKFLNESPVVAYLITNWFLLWYSAPNAILFWPASRSLASLGLLLPPNENVDSNTVPELLALAFTSVRRTLSSPTPSQRS